MSVFKFTVTQVRNSWKQLVEELKEWDLFRRQQNKDAYLKYS
jgi:hypothetical protein